MSKNHSFRSVFICLAVASLSLALAASGQSGWQTLDFVQVVWDTDPGVDGLEGSRSVALSPDGKHVYVAGFVDDAVAVFGRNLASGQLTFVDAVDDVVDVDNLDGPNSVVVSPDGKHVYVAASHDDALLVFSRNTTTGILTFVEVQKDGAGGVDGLDWVLSVTVSPDGNHVYVASKDDNSVAAFERNSTTGALTFVEVEKDGASGVDGLAWAISAAVSSDGRNVYVAGNTDDAVAVFSRDLSTGELGYLQVLRDGSGGVDGLEGAYSVAVSPDGNHVYAAGAIDNAVAVFSRNATTGMLAFVEMHEEGVGGVEGLDGPVSVTVSPGGHLVILVSNTGDAVAAFTRNPTTGVLKFKEAKFDGVGGVDGLNGGFFVTVSPDGNHVYAVSNYDDAAVVFESKGPAAQESPPTFLTEWGSQGSGSGEFDTPRGLAAGSLYVVDTNNDRIQKFDGLGNFVTQWGSQGSTNGAFDDPYDVAVDSSGYVYVADTGNDRIQVFDSDGSFERKWGSTGSAAGDFDNPFTVAVDSSSSSVYVGDGSNYRIQKFDIYGNYQKEWGSQGRQPGQFTVIFGVAVGKNGDVYVADTVWMGDELHRIQRFDSNGVFITSWGAGPGDGNGRLDVPGRLAVDKDGNLYVPDTSNNRIQKFDQDGNFLVAWGTAGSGPGQFDGPNAVAVDAIGRVYVADTKNHRIQVFGGSSLDFFIGELPMADLTLRGSSPSRPEVPH